MKSNVISYLEQKHNAVHMYSTEQCNLLRIIIVVGLRGTFCSVSHFGPVTRLSSLPQEYLNLLSSTISNGGAAPPDRQRAPSQRLVSVSSTTAPTQPLLSSSDVFLEYDTV